MASQSSECMGSKINRSTDEPEESDIRRKLTLGCLHKEIGTKQNMECPTCQRSITIPEGGVNAIPQNLHLGFEVEVAGYMSKIGSDGEKSCDACIDGSTGPAVVFCCTCHHLLCKLCHDNHKRNKTLYHHQIVRLDKESLKLLPLQMKPTEYLCSQPNHEKQVLKFYCETCQSLTCRECTLVLHKDHRIAEMCNIAKVHRDAMREALMCAQEVTSKLTRAIYVNLEMAEQVETSRENATLIINHAFEQLHQTIEERKITLLSEMEAILASKTTALILQKEQLMKMQDEIGCYTEMTSHILQTHTEHEMVALGNLLPTELKTTLKRVENVSLTPNQTSDIHVSLHTDSLIKELSIFGHVVMDSSSPSQSTWSSKSVAKVKKMYSIKVETMTSKGERYPYGGLLVKAELKPQSHDGAVVPGQVNNHGDGTYTITLTPQTAGPHQLLITMDGQHIQKSPFDLDVVMGVVHDGQFNHPCGLFITGDVMYVADSDNHRIQKLTTGGQFLQMFGHHGSGQGQFVCPASVIIDQRDRLIVSDHCNHRIVILDQVGTWLLTINGNVTASHGFQSPFGLALDPQGNIHVAAYGSNSIKVFTPEGTYVRSYGDVKSPSGIVIDEEGYSLVSEMTGNCLSIFHPLGNKIHSVCDLNVPQGVILDPKSGSLYVANYGANTVFVFETALAFSVSDCPLAGLDTSAGTDACMLAGTISAPDLSARSVRVGLLPEAEAAITSRACCPSTNYFDFRPPAQIPPHFTCWLCYKPYKEPRILPCLHSFCGQCLHKEIERSGTKQNMECPTCQRSITIPEGGVNAIPQNLHLGFEVEVARYMSKIDSDGEKSCDACIDGSTGPAVVFCCTCHHLLCKLCHDNHKRNKILCHHRIVGLDKESLELLPSIMKPNEHLCSQPHHEEEVLKFYCETCQLLICRDCTLVLHKDHRTAEMCNIAKVHRDTMREALVCAQEVNSKLTRAIYVNLEMAEQVETSRQNATLIITQAFEQLHQTIVERKESLLSEVESISLSKTTALALQKEQLMKMQDEIGCYTEMTSNILQTHTDNEMVALGDLLPTELKTTMNKVENVSLTPNQTNDIHVSLHTDSLIKELSIFGHVVMDSSSPSQSTWSSKLVAKVKKMYSIKVTTTSKGERYPYGGLLVKAELRPKSHDGAVVPGEVEDHGNGTYTITLCYGPASPPRSSRTPTRQFNCHSLSLRPMHTHCL
eukprot:Em0004g1694a